MTQISTPPPPAGTATAPARPWQPTLTRKEAKAAGIRRKRDYRQLALWARMVVTHHEAAGTPRPEWEGTATQTEHLVGGIINGANARLARTMTKADRNLAKVGKRLDTVESKIEDLGDPRSVDCAESGIKYSAQSAEDEYDRLRTKIQKDEEAGQQHHRPTPRLIRRGAPLLPWLEAFGLLGFVSYFLNVPILAPWEDLLGFTLGLTIVVVIIFSQTLLVHAAGKAHNGAREAEAEGNRQAAEDGRSSRNIFIGLGGLVALGITAGLILRGMETLGHQGWPIRAEIIFLAVLAGVLMPIVTYLAVAMDGSTASRERDSLAKALSRDMRRYRKATTKARKALHRSAGKVAAIRTTGIRKAVNAAEKAATAAAWRHNSGRVLIGGLAAEPEPVRQDWVDDTHVEIALGTPNTHSLETTVVTERLEQAASVDARIAGLGDQVYALSEHPWASRHEETIRLGAPTLAVAA